MPKKFSVTWTAPANNGGAAITDYKIGITPSGGSETVTSHGGTTPPHEITGLTDGVTYGVRVRAVNAVGDGAWSSTVNQVAALLPDAPSALSLTPQTSALDLSWTAPADNGGAAITGYTVRYRDLQPLTGVALLAPLDSDLNDVLGITATAVNTPTITTGGQYGSYADLGAGDKITYSSVSFGSGDYTVEFWVKRTEASWSPNSGNPLLELPGVAMIGRAGTDTLQLHEDDFGSWLAVSGTTTGSIDQNWHHIALVRDSNTLRFYFDGIEVGTMSTTSNPSSLVLGASTTYGCRFGIDDLRVSTSAVYPSGTTFTPPCVRSLNANSCEGGCRTFPSIGLPRAMIMKAATI